MGDRRADLHAMIGTSNKDDDDDDVDGDKKR